MGKIRRDFTRKIQKSFEPAFAEGYGVPGHYSTDVTDWNDRQKGQGD